MTKRTTVTQLVDFAKCEKLGILKTQHKEKLSVQRQSAIDRGVRQHIREERKVVVDGRCFVASFALGENAHELALLREFRDLILLRSFFGRKLVTSYYAASPVLVKLLRIMPGGKFLARICVRGIWRIIGAVWK